jgi:anti-anti-sigma factor
VIPLAEASMEKSSSPPVRIDVAAGSRPGVVILQIHGPLEITNFAEFEQLTRGNQAPVLIIDLADVSYIDSAVLGSLVAMHVASARNQRKYALVNANQRIQNMLTVSGVGEVLISFPTLAEAESSL